MVDEATEGEGLGAESGDCGGVARQLVPVGGCSGCNECKSETPQSRPSNYDPSNHSGHSEMRILYPNHVHHV